MGPAQLNTSSFILKPRLVSVCQRLQSFVAAELDHTFLPLFCHPRLANPCLACPKDGSKLPAHRAGGIGFEATATR